MGENKAWKPGDQNFGTPLIKAWSKFRFIKYIKNEFNFEKESQFFEPHFNRHSVDHELNERINKNDRTLKFLKEKSSIDAEYSKNLKKLVSRYQKNVPVSSEVTTEQAFMWVKFIKELGLKTGFKWIVKFFHMVSEIMSHDAQKSDRRKKV